MTFLSTRPVRSCPPARTRGAVLAALSFVAASTAGCSSLGAGDQGDPASTATKWYTSIGNEKFTDACDVLEEAARQQITDAGQSCERVIEANIDAESRAPMAKTSIDEDQVVVTGEVASIPQGAITFDGQPSTNGDVPLVEKDGRWYIANRS